MKLRRVDIYNIRSIEHLEWQPQSETLAGWHVILGDNGAGKSSVLRSIALALLGPREGLAARQNWNAWLRHSDSERIDSASVSIELIADQDYDFFSKQGRRTSQRTYYAGVVLERVGGSVQLDKETTRGLGADRHVWAGNGWFSAAYGPFRRFAGGDRDADRIFFSNPRLGAHISVFGEDVALTESLLWLQELNYQLLEKRPEGALLELLMNFVNQDHFLPHDVKLDEVTSKAVNFRDANGNLLEVEQLSDGYRAVLSMTFELIRQLRRTFSVEQMFSPDGKAVVAPGVVLIDEIDAHLHPTWQKQIGWWLIEHFPEIQFIVTTHSPLVCQAAAAGSIFRLAEPGSSGSGEMLKGSELNRLLYGDILEAYSTEAFGTSDTRSEEGQHKQARLAELNNKEVFVQLASREKDEQRDLQAIFGSGPTSMSTESSQ